MQLNIPTGSTKDQAMQILRDYAENQGLTIAEEDITRPWGAFFVIDQGSISDFIEKYFYDLPKEQIFQYGKDIRPKFLMLEPGKRFSWQYHNRRAELWKVISDDIGLNKGETDDEPAMVRSVYSELIVLDQGTRHRLNGLENWGIVAEIWQHTDPANLSNEEDIVRLQDDFGRN